MFQAVAANWLMKTKDWWWALTLRINLVSDFNICALRHNNSSVLIKLRAPSSVPTSRTICVLCVCGEASVLQCNIPHRNSSNIRHSHYRDRERSRYTESWIQHQINTILPNRCRHGTMSLRLLPRFRTN